MDMSGSHFIPAPQERVWAALNDPELLKACITGCEQFEADGEHSYKLLMAVKIGPVRARFTGKMDLCDLNPPNAYALGFEGQGGVAGFAKGKSDVTLSPEGEGTRLAYTARAQIGGKLAQIGSRLVDGAARKMADDFFAAFVQKLGGTTEQAGMSATAPQ
ncbi:CoxG family protein [Noviherbaspirillum massiliense]|uniref:CoxG family protein n=1 Tax=Noviherbaspirillum massiliense TaxID=1465823 RepID=UPI0002EC5540|nr:carbon monoxide dehydrogenase subunit G [Noviherbaspirillum massiliense]